MSHFKLEVARLEFVARSLVLGKGVDIWWFVWHLPDIGVEDRVLVNDLLHSGGLLNGGRLFHGGGLVYGGGLFHGGWFLSSGRVLSKYLTVGVFPVGLHLGEIKKLVVLNHRIRQRAFNTFLSPVRLLNCDHVLILVRKVDLVASSVLEALLDWFALLLLFRATSDGVIETTLALFLGGGCLLVQASSAGPGVT